MPAKSTKKTATKKSPAKKSVVNDYDSDYEGQDATHISPPESNAELNVELMEHVTSLTKRLENASKVQQEFVNAFEGLKDFSDASIQEIDMKIKKKDHEYYEKYDTATKKHALDLYNLEKMFKEKDYDLNKTFNMRKDNMEKEFNLDEYNKAKVVLRNKDEIPVREREFVDLKTELDTLTKNQKQRENEIQKEADVKAHKELNARLANEALQFKATSADMKAKIDQQVKEITILNNTIQTLREEIVEQRKLTKSVAEATQKSIQQTFSK